MRILLDTDIGSDIDDALALLLLLRLPEIELVGVTTVYGRTDIRARVAKKILNAARRDVPVFAGASEPLRSTTEVWHAGTEGRGALTSDDLAEPLAACGIRLDATEFIIDTLNESAEPVTVVCLGALTNLARAFVACPEAGKNVSCLFFMGGGITYRQPVPRMLNPGESYRAQESHNVRCDVEAARIVFESGCPMRILTNDVTTQLWWDGQPVQTLIQASQDPADVLVGKLLDIWLGYRSAIFGRPVTGTCPHDPLTVAEAAGYEFTTFEPGEMTINRDGSTVFVPGSSGRHAAGAHVDSQRFLDWFSRQICGRGDL